MDGKLRTHLEESCERHSAGFLAELRVGDLFTLHHLVSPFGRDTTRLIDQSQE
jgi:hypothetical protein